MIINKTVPLHHIVGQVLNKCPATSIPEFEDGFIDFVQDFTKNIEFYFTYLKLDDGSADADLELSLELTYSWLTRFKDQNSLDYWKGVELAQKLYFEILSLAFNFLPENKVA